MRYKCKHSVKSDGAVQTERRAAAFVCRVSFRDRPESELSVLIPGVEIGEYATIGAGSVVTKPIPAGAVAAGAPARILYYKPGYGPDAEETKK